MAASHWPAFWIVLNATVAEGIERLMDVIVADGLAHRHQQLL